MNKATRVLIIDDDPVYCRLLHKGLGRLGYQCDIAHNSAEALGLEAKLDVILLDMRLGEESGLGLIPGLQSRFPGARIVVVTGYANLATAVTAVKNGASNYIAKPVDVNDIHAIIQESLFDDDGDDEIKMTTIPEQAPSLKRLEWEHIHRVLDENEGNISRTALKLGMHRRTLQRKLKKHTP